MSNEMSALRISHQLVADLWYELPGSDEDREKWKDDFLVLLIHFDLDRLEFEYPNHALVRKAWETSFRFHQRHIDGQWQDVNTKTQFCSAIARRLLEFVNGSPEVFWANIGWTSALLSGTRALVFHQN